MAFHDPRLAGRAPAADAGPDEGRSDRPAAAWPARGAEAETAVRRLRPCEPEGRLYE